MQIRWLHVFCCRDEESGLVLQDDQCIITIELPTWQKWFTAGKESILELLNRSLYFLTNAKGTDQDTLLSQLDDPEFKEAINVIEGYTKDQKQRHAYDMRENYKRLVNSYIYTGYKQGKHQEKLELARKLKDKGMSDEEIMEITGLTPEEMAGL
jgi:predicted transposase/invertase (TIGR01784 family)